MSDQPNFRPRRLATACALAIACAGAPATVLADEGVVRGELSSALTETALEGARVRLLEAERETYTDARGRFRFDEVEPGEYTLVVDYVGLGEARETVTVAEDGEVRATIALGGEGDQLRAIQVTGQLAGQARAINEQRASDNIKTVVAAEEIGEFPDQNTAESLQRVPGTSITRDQGEGRFVSIRGADGNLNATNINGMRVPSAESDQRQVALDVIPSDLLSGLEVTKSVTPDMDGDAVGGTIDIRTLNAFDHDGRRGSVRLEGGYNDFRDSWSPRVGGNYSDLYSVGEGEDNLGMALGLTYEDRELGSDNVETDEVWLEDENTGNRYPEQLEQRKYIVDRERTGAAFNLDFRADENSEYYLRTLYSEFEDNETRRRNQYDIADGYDAYYDDATGDEPTINSNGGTVDTVGVGKDIKLRDEVQTIFSTVAGGENRIGDWTIDYELGYAKAKEEEPGRIDAEFTGEFDDVSYTTGKKFSVDGPDGMYEASNYALDEVVYEDNITEDEETSLALNFREDTELLGNPGYWKFGFKGRWREKYADMTAKVYEGGPEFDQSLADWSTDVDHSFANMGPGVQSSLQGFVESNRENWDYNEDDYKSDSLAGDYEVTEDVYAGYLMGSMDMNRLRLLGGARVEMTDYSAKGHELVEDEDAGTVTVNATSEDNDYVDVLPNLQLRYELTPRSLARAAITQTLARPNFEDAAPYVEKKLEGGEEEYEAGNPDLDPYRSTNLDLMYEFYPEGTVAAYTFGVFYKDIQDYVVTTDVAGKSGYGDAALNAAEYITAINGDSATILGWEASAFQHLDFLPSPWDGMLVAANYTWVDSEAELPGRDEKIQLPAQAEQVGNFSLGYEKYGLSVRASVAWRDEYLDEVFDVEDPAADRYAAEHTQFDLTASYDVSDSLQVYAEGINLNDEPFHAYVGEEKYNSQYDEFGPTYKLGVNLRY